MKLVEPIVAWHSEFTEIRRDLHAHPELGFEEVRSSDLVAGQLASWGIPVERGLGVTGVVGMIEGRRRNGKAVGLRADMDALPMQEANDFAHASRHPGKMHACGHDGHTTMLLAAARHLAQDRDFDGTVYVIFQPAEEGQAGARAMLEDGLLERCPMDALFGLHNWPGLPAGHFALRPGPIMASSNTFEITLTGRGAHGAMPHLGADPVMAAVQVAQSLQTIVSRNCDPMDPTVLSITQIHSGSADNVIPNEAVLRGTVRTFADAPLTLIETRMAEIAGQVGQAMGCETAFRFDRRYPPTLNHAAETALCAEVATQLAGPDRVRQDLPPSMGAEDFAFMLQARPGCYVWLGNGDGGHRTAGHGAGPCMLHNGSYDFNDALIPIGASYWTMLARHWLARHA